MKIRLVTLFLIATTLPFFIHANTKKTSHLPFIQKQLEVLKEVKNQTNYYLERFTIELNELDHPFWLLYLKLWDNCINLFDPYENQALTEVEIYFNVLCNKQEATLNLLGVMYGKSIWETEKSLMKTTKLILTTVREKGGETLQQQHYQTILSLITDQLPEWREVGGFKICSIEEIAEALFGECLCGDSIHRFYLATRIVPNLLKKIDIKIAELTAKL